MKRKINQIKIAGFLSFAVFCFGINFGATAEAQETQRQKTGAKSTPTPRQTPLLTATPTPVPTPVPVQTAAELQGRIRQTLSRPEIRRGQVGVKIMSFDTGRTVFEENAEKYFMPASNMKSYTVAAALEKLSPDFRFVTSVYALAAPDAGGAIRGDLTVYGRGDVSMSYSFSDDNNNVDYYKGLDALAVKIVQAGVKRIEGSLVGDESYFTSSPIPPGWEWDDLQWYYGAEVSALPVNDNVVDLSVKPGSATGAPCAVALLPLNQVVRITNQCTTSAPGSKRDLRVFKKLDQNILEISGTISADDKGFKNFVAVSRPSEMFLANLRYLLTQKGVVITGQNRIVDAKYKANFPFSAAVVPVEITKLESPPFSLIAAKTMKPSQNLYTETILRALGERMKTLSTQNVQTASAVTPASQPGLSPDNPFTNPKAESDARGLFVVQNFLREIGVAPDSVLQYDGSGLSRHNLVTPASLVQLYAFMARSRYANVWRDALPVGGVDGTLKNRFTKTAGAGNVRAKTGTIDQVSALSGYVTTASGERLVFSTIVNDVADGKIRQAVIDEIVVALANFNGKTN